MNIELELNLATNIWGYIPNDIKERIRNLIENPTIENWDDCHGIILNATPGLGLTLWQAILEIDPTFPKTGRATITNDEIVREWKRIPTSDLIRRALIYATH